VCAGSCSTDSAASSESLVLEERIPGKDQAGVQPIEDGAPFARAPGAAGATADFLAGKANLAGGPAADAKPAPPGPPSPPIASLPIREQFSSVSDESKPVL